MSVAAGDGVLAMLLSLFHALRAAGVPVSMVEVLDAAEAVTHVDIADRRLLRAALSATLVKRLEDEAVFAALFDRCFPLTRPERTPSPIGTGEGPDDLTSRIREALRADDDEFLLALADEAVDRHAGLGIVDGTERYFTQRVLRALDLAQLLAAAMHETVEPGATPFERRLQRDEQARRVEAFRRMLAEEVRRRLTEMGVDREAEAPRRLDELEVLGASTTDLRDLRAAVRPLARKLAARIAQRRRRRRHGRLDVRRTMRRSLGTGGVPLDPAFRSRRATKPVVVILCDLSGSVAEFAHFTLSLMHALHNELAGLRSFVFVDGIAEVTGIVDAADEALEPRQLLAQPGVIAGDGHSDYAAVFERFALTYAARAVTPATTLIVAGDARTNYRPSGAATFRTVAARARRTYWLDPEPRERWGVDDSRIHEFAPACTAVFEVRMLRQLADAVVAMV